MRGILFRPCSLNFLPQVRVPGFDYTGAGNSTSKKDAHANAAQDFCAYLVRSGKLREDQVPVPGAGSEAPGGGVSRTATGGTPGGAPHQHLAAAAATCVAIN